MTTTQLFADTVFKGANIVTVDPALPRAEALAIRGGLFVGVGSDNDIEGLIGPGTTVRDMRGKTIIPGLIDAHIHVLSSGTRHVMAADCDQRSIADIQAVLRERVADADRGDWIQGFKFDDTKTRESRFLNKADLDAVTTELPIMVSHRAGHVYYLNTVALEEAGYNNESDDPPGGRLGRDPATGELDGVIYERAVEPLRASLPQVTAETRRQGLKTICGMLGAAGLTSVHDAMVSDLEINSYQEGHDNGDLALRVYMLAGRAHFPALRDAGMKSGFGNDRLRLGGIKMVSDGAIAARTAYLS
ncbi:MAG: amidohydrolase family protein, partial [SAR202 cluster bacterium]|nr:amidohydrolase family protein [SAR202 cluster bacterium]